MTCAVCQQQLEKRRLADGWTLVDPGTDVPHIDTCKKVRPGPPRQLLLTLGAPGMKR